ncbi:MAG: nucleoside monophosphate kinase [Patescibacteria group bacterium]|nr:nucleoside monophosphate kinase [Patescibacteria group bacterium]MDD5121034.1 nucleoside monophosphate kinase [Patescibacteria group bacterium]MDD5221605.1 nucleoside monophosphate kinase [Patescibacteria group bacterium]MDD5396047.1 nucleoside monophosphate kinase [Patescibacteria group bacterium]
MNEQEKQKIGKLKIAFIGRPGTGKGTQTEILHQETGLVLIPSPGDIYRDPEFRKTPLGKEIGEGVDKGIFAPNEVTNQIMKDKISALTNNNQVGFISEGYPRTLPQAEFAEKEIGINWMINLEVPESRLMERLSRRRVCPKCKTNFNFATNPPKNGNLCDICQVELVLRDDDKLENIKHRFVVYHETAEPTIEFYRQRNKIIDINGDRPVEDVAKSVLESLLNKIN